MNLSLRNKLLIGFMGVAMLVVVAGLTGIVMMRGIVNSTESIVEDVVPVKNASDEALLAVETAISGSREYVNNSTGLQAISSEIDAALAVFDSKIAFISERGDANVATLADKAAKAGERFKEATRELITVHNTKTDYIFNFKGVEYDLKTFLYYNGVQLAAWIDTLEEASTFKVAFTGGTDASKSDFGIWYKGFTTNDPELAKMLKKYNSLNIKAHESAERIDTAADGKKEAYFTRAKSRHFNNAKKQIKELQEYVTPIFDGINAEELKSLGNMKTSSAEIRSALLELGSSVDGIMAEAKESAFSSQRTSNLVLVLVIAFSLIAAVLIALFCARVITGPINNAVRVANRLGAGDLTVKIETNRTDEAGQLLRAMQSMVANLHELLMGVSSTTSHLATSSLELSAQAEELSRGVITQEEQANQVSTATEEMSSTAIAISQNIHSTAENARKGASLATEGGKVVEETRGVITQISDEVNLFAGSIKELGNSSKKIGEIVGVINDIADQTNLLALNAAIEAARAGEQGRGFAVVADEVRKLAERTSGATGEIADMITSIQRDTESAVLAMDKSLLQIETGVSMADKAGESLKQIVETGNALGGMVTQVATAAEQQTATTEEIAQSIESIANITRQSSAGISQTVEACQVLSRLADDLNVMVEKFKLSDAGQESSSAGPDDAEEFDEAEEAEERLRLVSNE